jgi:hypothetical protein
MPVLKSLSFTALPKNVNDPVQARRTKFVAKLEEQKHYLYRPRGLGTVRSRTASQRALCSGSWRIHDRDAASPCQAVVRCQRE